MSMIAVKRFSRSEALRQFKEINRLLPQLSPTNTGELITKDGLKECLQNPRFHIFIARSSTKPHRGHMAGMGTIFFQRNLGRWIAEIHDIVVDNECRGRGIGETIVRRLIKEAQRFAGRRGKKLKLYLTSRPARTAANMLYTKLGFTLVAEAVGEWGTNLYKMMIVPQIDPAKVGEERLKLLKEVLKPEEISSWLTRPHKVLDNRMPLDLIVEGKGNLVDAVLKEMLSSTFSE